MTPSPSRSDVGDLVERCAVLASLLEVSGYPKPGNVHRTRDTSKTRFEQFLAGAVAIGPAMRELAQRGYDAGRGRLGLGEIGLGEQILRAVREAGAWQGGGNVNLGIILLLSPLAAASGLHLSENERIDLCRLRRDLARVIRASTPRDTLGIYRAIRIAVSPRVLGRVEVLDVLDDKTLTRVEEEGVTPLRVFEECRRRDSICEEWVTDFSITFTLGYPYLKGVLGETGDINTAVVHTYLHILSRIPDSLIERKSGKEAALRVSRMAIEALEKGGLTTPEGRRRVLEMDEELHKAGGDLNPGTTADLTASSLYLLLIEGWRP